jgi:endonuclease-3
MRTSDRIKKIFSILKHHIPEAKIELDYTNSYELLVSVILSAQSTDIQVNKATEKLFKLAPNFQALLQLNYEEFCQLVSTVGLYKTKAKNILATAAILVEKYNGEVPNTREELMSLPGVGLKSANVILNVLYHSATVAVDTHVFRVARRLGFSEAKSRDSMSHELEKLLPQHLDPETMLIAHHLLVLQGRYTCKAIKPKCESCPIYKYCHSPDKKEIS